MRRGISTYGSDSRIANGEPIEVAGTAKETEMAEKKSKSEISTIVDWKVCLYMKTVRLLDV